MKWIKYYISSKARDPHGFIDEVFKIDMIGDDMKESLYLMCYKIRDTLEVPELLKYGNITSIYKGKGAKNDILSIFIPFCIKIIQIGDTRYTIDYNYNVTRILSALIWHH